MGVGHDAEGGNYKAEDLIKSLSKTDTDSYIIKIFSSKIHRNAG